MEGQPLVLGKLWFRDTGLYVVGELGGLGDGLDTEDGGAEVGVGGLVEVKGLGGSIGTQKLPERRERQYL